MELVDAKKHFNKCNKKIEILNHVNIKFELGKLYLILGESGAGKSSLINILGLLDKLDDGKLIINDKDISNFSDKELSLLRLHKIGMIFQDYYLNPRLTAYENVYIASIINDDVAKDKRRDVIYNILKYFDVENRANHLPNEMSGGEQQRVCIARALINNPDYILADEPTGSLDLENAIKVMTILKKLALSGKCIILVTHDYNNLKYADYVYSMRNGKLKLEQKDDILKKYIEKK